MKSLENPFGARPMTATGSARYLFPQLGKIYERLGDFSWVLVRGIYGFFYIPHGCQKLFGWFGGSGLAGVAQGFAHEGLQPAYFWARLISGPSSFSAASRC